MAQSNKHWLARMNGLGWAGFGLLILIIVGSALIFGRVPPKDTNTAEVPSSQTAR